MLDTLAPLAAQTAVLLNRRRETIAVADGATGGLIQAGLLTVPGATSFCLAVASSIRSKPATCCWVCRGKMSPA